MAAAPSPPHDPKRPPSENDRPRLAVLGLGAMGSRVAARLHDAGIEVTVWNRSQPAIDAFVDSRAVSVATSPHDAAVNSDIVVSFVTNDDASDSVWLDADTGALPAIGNGVGVEMSTITPGHAARLHREAALLDVHFLDAPVVGSRPQAEAGALVVLVGGVLEALDGARDTLELLGAVHHVGSGGSAATLKLAINGLFAAQVASFAEIVTLLDASDIDTASAQQIISGLPITSAAMQRVLGLFDAANYSPNFPVRLVAKDLDYLDRSATALGVELSINHAVSALFTRAAQSDAAELDIAGVITAIHSDVNPVTL